jgi:hypothetical protein
VSRNETDVPGDDRRRESLDLPKLRYEPLAQRPSKVTLADLGRVAEPGASFVDWLETLPPVLGANALVRLCDAITSAHAERRPVAAAVGGHVV